MRYFFFILFIGFAFTSTAQIDSTIYTVVQIKPAFPGGPQVWKRYLEKNLNPELGQKHIVIPEGQQSASQTVIVSFVVDKEGIISDIKVDNEAEVHKALAKEAVKIIKKGPKWVPAVLEGRNVTYRHKQHITWVASAQ